MLYQDFIEQLKRPSGLQVQWSALCVVIIIPQNKLVQN